MGRLGVAGDRLAPVGGMGVLGAHAGYPKQRIGHHFGRVNRKERSERQREEKIKKAEDRDLAQPLRLSIVSNSDHAEGGTRTRTGLRPLRPERSASTSSTTSARAEALMRRRGGINPGHEL